MSLNSFQVPTAFVDTLMRRCDDVALRAYLHICRNSHIKSHDAYSISLAVGGSQREYLGALHFLAANGALVKTKDPLHASHYTFAMPVGV